MPITGHITGAAWSKGAVEGTASAGPLQDEALVLLAATFPLQECSTCGMLEHLSDTLVGLG